MMAGLNLERVVYSAGMLDPMRESIRHAITYAQRRMQFDKPTIDMPSNQAKIAEMLARLYTSRLLVYCAAHLLDQLENAMVEAATAKMSASDTYEKLISDVIQVMGGDGWTRFYPLETYLQDAKVNQIGAGTNQIMKLVVFRGGQKAMTNDLRMPKRRIHQRPKVPMTTAEPVPKLEPTEDNLLKTLADDYTVNPGLYMTREDLKESLYEVTEERLDEILKIIESKGWAKLYRDSRKTITLAKATYGGLRKANELYSYKWYPDWLKKEYIF